MACDLPYQDCECDLVRVVTAEGAPIKEGTTKLRPLLQPPLRYLLSIPSPHFRGSTESLQDIPPIPGTYIPAPIDNPSVNH